MKTANLNEAFRRLRAQSEAFKKNLNQYHTSLNSLKKGLHKLERDITISERNFRDLTCTRNAAVMSIVPEDVQVAAC